MSDGFSLLLVLVVVYLYDCVIFLHRQSVALVRPWRTWRIRLPGWQVGNAKGALLGLQPLPPLGMIHETAPWPISLSEDGLCVFTSASYTGPERPPQSGRTVLFGDVKEVATHGHDVLVNGVVLATVQTAALATRLAELVTALAAAPRERRRAMIGAALDTALDVDSARAASEDLDSTARGLRRTCNALWIFIYVVCPIATALFGLTWLIIPLAIAGLTIHVPIVVWFARMHRRLYPDDRGERYEHILRMSLCPPMAIRAVDSLCRHRLLLHHPAAAAIALCPREESAALAGFIVRDLRYPAPIPLEGDGLKIESSFRVLLTQRMQAMLDKHGVPVQTTPAPELLRPDTHTFCPRCLNLFTLDQGVCRDCSDLKLEPLHAQPPQHRSKQ